MLFSDSDLLRIVADERRRSIGFELDAFLLGDRERALNYVKGEMPDIPALPNRSKAVSTDIADAVETVMPDLVEIFTGGDDVAAFTPENPGDEQAATQETDYVNHVVFHENDGFMLLYSLFKDALVEKIGVATWWWAEDVRTDKETFEGKNLAELALAAQDGEITDQEEVGQDPQFGPLYDFTLTRTRDRSTVKIMTVSPDDFTVAADTVSLKETTYCAMRARPRAQDLKVQGFDPALIDELPPYGTDKNTAIEIARDTAGENSQGVPSDAGGEGDLRIVEVVTHFVRLLDDDGGIAIWRVVTGGGETVLLEAERVNRINFAAITPYPVAHRFYGRALADLLVEVQRIKTVLTRMVLDSGYFALNQRVEVSEEAMSTNTIADLLRNEPGVPVRSRNGEAVRPIASGALSFDVFGALEYFSTVAESRTGVVRNAQGLNPDTLHDTAKGAIALMTAAQKRVRLIARIFAETGIKDLFLGVHATIRENASAPRIARLKGQWISVDPSTWAERNDMTIEVGLGASGRDFEIAALSQVANVMQSIVTEQGGAVGPVVTAQNVYAAAKRLFGKLGIKTPELFLTDPSSLETPALRGRVRNSAGVSGAGQSGAGQPAPPDPKLLDVQLTHQREQQKIANDAQFRQRQLEAETALKRYEIDQKTRVDLANAIAATHSPAPMAGPNLSAVTPAVAHA
jgi:hypothetical protein